MKISQISNLASCPVFISTQEIMHGASYYAKHVTLVMQKYNYSLVKRIVLDVLRNAITDMTECSLKPLSKVHRTECVDIKTAQ